jgi:hypothetical protein
VDIARRVRGQTLARRTVVADVTKSIEFIGPAVRAGALVECLEEEGVKVRWTAPEEERGVGRMAEEVAVAIVAAGGYDAIKLGVRKFRERFGTGRVKIEGEDD